jgi:hypothetical protein
MPSEVHAGDVGTVFEATIRNDAGIVDVSDASVLRMIFTKPDAAVVEKTATLSGSGADGKMRYVTVAGDLDVAGGWQLQAYVEKSGGQGHSSIYRFSVRANL